jgi:hypothetical protein
MAALSLLFEHFKKLKSRAARGILDRWFRCMDGHPDTFIWAPHLTYYAGAFIADAALHLPVLLPAAQRQRWSM